MLSNYINQRVSGVNGLSLPDNIRAASLELGQRSKARREAVNSYASGGRASYGGARLDSRGKDVSEQAKRDAALHLRAVEWSAHLKRTGRQDATIPQASQALTTFLTEVYSTEKSGLSAWDGEILPIDSTADPAAEEIVWYETDIVGAPKAGNTYSISDIPLVVGPVASSNRIRVIPALIGMDVNFMDGRRAAMARSNGKPDFDIDAGKIEIARRVIAEMANALWLAGDSALGIDGLFTSPLIGDIPPSPAVWSTLTGVQLNAELDKLFNFISNAAQGGLLKDISKVTVMLPPTQYDLVTSLPITANGSTTVWQFFRDSHGLKDSNLVKQYELAAANSAVIEGGAPVLARDTAYITHKVGDRWDPRFTLPQQIEIPAPPRNTGLGEVTYMHARMGELMIPDARRIASYTNL